MIQFLHSSSWLKGVKETYPPVYFYFTISKSKGQQHIYYLLKFVIHYCIVDNCECSVTVGSAGDIKRREYMGF